MALDLDMAIALRARDATQTRLQTIIDETGEENGRGAFYSCVLALLSE